MSDFIKRELKRIQSASRPLIPNSFIPDVFFKKGTSAAFRGSSAFSYTASHEGGKMAHTNAVKRVALVLEAFLGGFYVAVTRGLFVPMLAYSGYSVDLISKVLLPTSVGGILASLALYRKPEILTGSFKYSLLLLHVAERIAWFSLPFLVRDALTLATAYLLANIISAVVSISIASLIFSIFPAEEVMEVSVQRSAASSAASLIGSLFITYVSAAVEPPQSYYFSYTTAMLIGLSSSLSLLLIPSIPSMISEASSETEEVRIRSSIAIIVMSLMLAGANMVGISWSPFLKEIGAPVYLAVSLSITGNLGGAIGSYLWRGYRGYAIAMLLNTLATLLIPFVHIAAYHVGISFLTSLTFIGANLLGMQIFSEVSKKLGRVRASAYLTSSNYLGLLLATLLSIAWPLEPSQTLILAGFIKLSGLVLTLLAVPEAAVIPARRAYELSRMLYSTSLLGYSFTLQASKEFFKMMVAVLSLAALLVVLYIIYRVSSLILGI